ncbi:MAG TPA: hypothetical protein VMD08_02640, partial [Candidatus Baltobacteraceae bacterium]|nr:hypothetical protein [Candidatus Baltobacteraceae bacterium]
EAVTVGVSLRQGVVAPDVLPLGVGHETVGDNEVGGAEVGERAEASLRQTERDDRLAGALAVKEVSAKRQLVGFAREGVTENPRRLVQVFGLRKSVVEVVELLIAV